MDKNNLNGLTVVNVETTNSCNKKCKFCGRRKVEKDYPELAIYNKDMNFKLLEKIAVQLPKGILVQIHNNGEPTLYPKLGEAIKLFNNQITCFNTNGKLIVEKADEIIDNLDSLTISVIQDDPEWNEQYKILKEFLKIKDNKKPIVILRQLGKLNPFVEDAYKQLNLTIAKRILHSPMGSFKYEKETTVPEHGICLDMLNHLAINVDGDVSICVRFDPTKKGVIGNIKDSSLRQLWNSYTRKIWLKSHIEGKRENVPLCKTCEFWGIPRG